MRVALLFLIVVSTGCLSTASKTQFESVGTVTVNARLKPLQNPDEVKQVPGTDPIACAAQDGGTLFIDATDAWNLGKDGLNLVGNRLTVADLDGDGYPDLVVHAVSSNARQSLDGGKRLVWQLMNRPTADGRYRTFVDESGNGLFDVLGGSTTQYRSAQLAVFGDVDNDGDLDAFSGTYTDPTKPETDPGDRSEILLNDGNGHFTIAPESATTPLPNRADAHHQRHLHRRRPRRPLDVFVGNWYEAYGDSYLGVQARLFHGARRGPVHRRHRRAATCTPTPRGYAAFTNHRPAYGVTACDLDDDGAPGADGERLRPPAEPALPQRRRRPLRRPERGLGLRQRRQRRTIATTRTSAAGARRNRTSPCCQGVRQPRPSSAPRRRARAGAWAPTINPGATTATPSPPGAATSTATARTSSTTPRSTTGGRAARATRRELLKNVSTTGAR